MTIKFFHKAVASLALSTSLITGGALEAKATPQLTTMLSTIQATGTRVAVDDPRLCADPTLMGMYQFVKDQIDQYTICIKNHKGNNAELYDTVLHEAVHVVQACKGGPIYSTVSIIEAAKAHEIQTVGSQYPNQQFNVELEARVIAREQDEVFITSLLKEHCFK
jgi:hypothetical protein